MQHEVGIYAGIVRALSALGIGIGVAVLLAGGYAAVTRGSVGAAIWAGSGLLLAAIGWFGFTWATEWGAASRRDRDRRAA